MECTCLFLPPRHPPSPVHYRGRLSAFTRQNNFMTDPFSRLQPFRYVQALRFACLPDRSYRCSLSPQGSRGFYVRAEHASLPPHASDMLTTVHAIGGVGTYTPLDSQPCRLLQCSRDLTPTMNGSGVNWLKPRGNVQSRSGLYSSLCDRALTSSPCLAAAT